LGVQLGQLSLQLVLLLHHCHDFWGNVSSGKNRYGLTEKKYKTWRKMENWKNGWLFWIFGLGRSLDFLQCEAAKVDRTVIQGSVEASAIQID